MSGDFILGSCWPQGLVLDPEGCGGGGSGGLNWEGWLPHSDIGTIAKSLNCIFCGETGGNPISKSSCKCARQATQSQRGALETLNTALHFSDRNPSNCLPCMCGESATGSDVQKSIHSLNTELGIWMLQLQPARTVFLSVSQVLACKHSSAEPFETQPWTRYLGSQPLHCLPRKPLCSVKIPH